jgi:hypothetical protein
LQLSPLFHQDAQISELINLSILPLHGAVAVPHQHLKPVPDTFDQVFDAVNALIELAAPQGADRR